MELQMDATGLKSEIAKQATKENFVLTKMSGLTLISELNFV